MVTITDGKNKFFIDKRTLWNRKADLEGLATKLKYSYWAIELLFICHEKDSYEKIVKCYVDGDDYVKEYPNLDKSLKDTILLSEEDYNEVERLYANLNSVRDYREEAIIEAGAILFSYEYYQNYILEDGEFEIDVDEVFDLSDLLKGLKNYKKEIFEKSKSILKEKYDIDFSYDYNV